MLRFALAAFALVALHAAELPPADRRLNLESFEKVWTTVRDKHWDTRYNGVDWQAVRNEFRPRVEDAKSAAEARTAMQQMLERLKQTHFGIVPAEAYEELEAGGTRDGSPGIDTRLIENRVIVTHVQHGAPAETVGIRPGWELRAINGKELGAAIEKVRRGFRRDARLPGLLVRSMVEGRLQGKVGTRLKLTATDGQGKTREYEVERVETRGVQAKFGHLPPRHIWVENRRPAPNTGYVAFNMFLDPERVMKAVGDAVTSCAECGGFIIDLRGNPGGLGAMAMGMAGFFVERGGSKLGTMFLRNGKILFAVSPRPGTFRGRLAILVDGCSASTSEIFAEGMKDIGRARVFGTRTAGAALPSAFEKLPNGDGFQYAFADYISESGRRLEGNGVEPDVAAPLTRKALLEGRDPALDAAVEWIGSAPK